MYILKPKGLWSIALQSVWTWNSQLTKQGKESDVIMEHGLSYARSRGSKTIPARATQQSLQPQNSIFCIPRSPGLAPRRFSFSTLDPATLLLRLFSWNQSCQITKDRQAMASLGILCKNFKAWISTCKKERHTCYAQRARWNDTYAACDQTKSRPQHTRKSQMSRPLTPQPIIGKQFHAVEQQGV